MFNIKKMASDGLNTLIFEGKKKSPAILIFSGLVLGGVALYTTYKKAPEGHKIVKNCKGAIKEIKESNYIPEEDKPKMMAKTYGATAVQLGKTFAIPVAAEAASVTCVLTGAGILHKRLLGVAAAYSATCAEFKEYRGRVTDKFGEQVDKEMLLGTDTLDVCTVNEKGKEKHEKYEITDGKNKLFIKYFTKDNPLWDDDENMLKMTFSALQNSIDDHRLGKKFVTYNDILEMFYFEKDCCDGLVLGATVESGPVDISYKKVWIGNDEGGMEPAYAIEFKNLINIYKEK